MREHWRRESTVEDGAPQKIEQDGRESTREENAPLKRELHAKFLTA